MQRASIVLGLAAFGMLAGCSLGVQDRTVDWSADQLYREAKSEMNSGNYSTASDYQTKLLARYPYGSLAQQALLDLAYTYYRDGENDKAAATYDTFIRTYPSHPYIDYAYYMKGVVTYEKDVNLLSRLNPTNLAQTDPKVLQQAFDDFRLVVDKFPDSEYAEDARFRMLFLKNLLAQHQLEVADYYMRRGAYLAAANRGRNVITQFDGAPSVPYALALMTRAYQELGEAQLSSDSERILKLNFARKMNDPEIQHYLSGDISKKKNLWEIISSEPKI